MTLTAPDPTETSIAAAAVETTAGLSTFGQNYVTASLSGTARIETRTSTPLLLYPVSLGSDYHRNGHVLAAIKAIDKEFRHRHTNILNLIIHVTDGPYAYAKMRENPGMSYEEARDRARKEGKAWAADNLTGIREILEFYPVLCHWDLWDDGHGNDYQRYLQQVTNFDTPGHPEFNPAFHDAVNLDVQQFGQRLIAKAIKEGREPPEFTPHTEKMDRLFVLHEDAGYLTMAQYLRNDYLVHLKGLREQELRKGEETTYDKLEQSGGLGKNIQRLYPSHKHLVSIELLREGKRDGIRIENPPIITIPGQPDGLKIIQTHEIKFRYFTGSNHELSFRRTTVQGQQAVQHTGHHLSGAASGNNGGAGSENYGGTSQKAARHHLDFSRIGNITPLRPRRDQVAGVRSGVPFGGPTRDFV